MHLAPVLCDSSACDADAMVEQSITDLRVAEGAASGRFFTDDLLDYMLDAERRREEIAHRDHFPIGKHDELASYCTAAG